MTDQAHDAVDAARERPGGTTTLGDRTIARIGYGAMQLEHVAPDAATALLRRAVELGVDHIDTASFYGDATVNALLRRALHPWPEHISVVSKVGAQRVHDGSVPLAAAQRPDQLRAQVEIDLASLGVERLAAVNLRRMDAPPGVVATGSDVVALDDQLAELVALREEGKVGGIGLSHVDADQLRAALPVGIVCVQDAFNLVARHAEPVLDLCREHGIAWVPYFPLGSAFEAVPSPVAHPEVQRVAAEVGATPGQVALSWLLAHHDRTALIPGTRDVAHLEANLAAGSVVLSGAALAALDALAPAPPR